MASSNRGVDFITIDGGEGGTGAAPLVFSDHVALPFKFGMSKCSRSSRRPAFTSMWSSSVRAGSVLPDTGLFAFGLGCDMINVGREAMLAIGCIQAQRCHTDHCPTGVATQSHWLMRGLDPTSKSARLANYVVALRKELLRLSRACGVVHPSLITADHFDILDGRFGSKSVLELFGYDQEWCQPSQERRQEVERVMGGR